MESPDATPGKGDPGDDTARRYSYQWTYAATLACALLDDARQVAELYCEHHDDILLKHQDGSFSGIQVKTKGSGSDSWRTRDEAIRGALVRFARLEFRFPGLFREFVIATNHLFVRDKKTASDLPFLVDVARQAAEAAIPRILQPLLKAMATGDECSPSAALRALQKCRCDDSLPKLDDIKQSLVVTLSETWPDAQDTPYYQLVRAADALIATCGRASSLDHAQSLPRYLSAFREGRGLAENLAIDGKRLDRTRIESSLRESVCAAPLLACSAPTPIDPTTASTRLEKKLAAGGFSLVSINSAKDLRDKADYHSVGWLHRFGEKRGLQQREHVRSLVLADCAEAYEASKSERTPFGNAMRQALREQFRQRRQRAGATLFDCLDEHLEGYAYVLTDECRVWWSVPFDLGEAE